MVQAFCLINQNSMQSKETGKIQDKEQEQEKICRQRDSFDYETQHSSRQEQHTTPSAVIVAHWRWLQ